MNCEKCNKNIEKGYVEVIETTNLIYYVCMECALEIEDYLQDLFNKRGEQEKWKKQKSLQEKYKKRLLQH